MKETLKKLRETLRPIYGERETEAIIRLIFYYLKNWTPTDMLINMDKPLSPFIESEIDKILAKLVNHEPIQYITGEARFHGMDFIVSPDVLIPRPETDELTDLIIKNYEDKEDLRIWDIGTGSGCIAITLARNLKFPMIYATDVSEAAINIARQNTQKLKVRIQFLVQDIFKDAPEGLFDIIVSNPPYIDMSEKPSLEQHVLKEPSSALFVPDDNPLIFYKKIADVALEKLKPEGSLYFEINPRHAEELKNMLSKKGYQGIEIVLDSFGKKRFIIAKKGH